MNRSKKKTKIIYITTILGFFLIVYLWILFPILNSEIRNESKYSYRVDLWNSDGFSKLTYRYLERDKKPAFEKLQESFKDSIFQYNFYNDNSYTRSLRNSENAIVPSTNNYSLTTLKCYSLFISTKDSAYFNMFITASNWIKNNAYIVNDTIALWKNYDFVYDKYDLAFGWPSAFSQGFVIADLCRAFQETGDSTFLFTAEKAVNSFNYVNKSDGFAQIDETGNYWYFEYPAKEPGYVLNGMIFGLLGLHDYYRITGSPKAKKYFDRGVKTIKDNLQEYDLGYWSSYDLHYSTFVAGYFYHKYVHIPLLNILYQITGDKVFKEYQNKFESYLNEPYFTLFKVVFTVNGIQRYVTYKNPIKLFSKDRFNGE